MVLERKRMHHDRPLRPPRQTALIGTRVSCQCGITAFTRDLNPALRNADNRLEGKVIPKNDGNVSAKKAVIPHDVPNSALYIWQSQLTGLGAPIATGS